MNPQDVTVALAVEDYVPVILTAIAVARLAGWTPVRRSAAVLGAALIAVGGLSKASWKLLAVGFDLDIAPMAQALFPCLASGFTLLAWSLLAAAGRRLPWPVPTVAIAAALGASAALGRTWPALILTIIGATGLAVALILRARATGDQLSTVLSLVWIAGQYALGPLAAKAGQTLTLQWIEQGCNSLAQAALVVAAWRLTRTRAVVEVPA